MRIISFVGIASVMFAVATYLITKNAWASICLGVGVFYSLGAICEAITTRRP